MKYSIAHIYIPVPVVSARLDVWNYRAEPPAFGALVCLLMIHLVNIAERPKINHFQCVVIEIMKFWCISHGVSVQLAKRPVSEIAR